MLYDHKGRPLLSTKEREEDHVKAKYAMEKLVPKAVEMNGHLCDMELSAVDAVSVLTIVLGHAVHQSCKNDRTAMAHVLRHITDSVMAITDPDPAYRDFFNANYETMADDIGKQ